MSPDLGRSFSTLVVAATLAAAGVVWFVLQPRSHAEVRVPDSLAAPSGKPLPKGTTIGNTGCLAAACHSGPATESLSGKFDANTWQGSGTCFTARDPHTRAYSLLTDQPDRPVRATARQIMEKLHSTIPATEDIRCLACHSNPSLATSGPANPHTIALRKEGVGCEACHGNASGWLREHTTWRSDNPSEYAGVGMTPLFDIGERAMTCLGCHVGAPADPTRVYPVRDMNHDMIAAGHPRLDFDFGEFHRVLPKHWLEKERTPTGLKPRSPAFDARLWIVGRVAQAEAACKLLADRADRAKADDPRTPWPELAEFNCAACHHDLPQPWRSEPKTPGTRMPGSPRWQTIWPITAFDGFGDVQPVLTIMQKKRPAGFGEINPVASQTANKLADVRQNTVRMSDADLVWSMQNGLPRKLSEHPEWDTAGQMLWGVAAMERAQLVHRPASGFAGAFDAVRERDWAIAKPALEKLFGKP